MTAQASKEATNWGGKRSFVLYPGSSFMTYDYLTQQCSGEMMFGGGFMKHRAYLTEIGNVDDSGWNRKVSEYLSTAMGEYFGIQTRVLGTWGGIFAVSADEMPWVGRVPDRLSQRKPMTENKLTGYEEVPGEWMAGGYTGEGMVHAWLCGKAVGLMVLGLEAAELPAVFRTSASRL
jgi:glycine/D-amino acid oxidase-like deaminating enzyme